MIRILKKIERAKRFKKIRLEKIQRVLKVRSYLDEWQDIPMSQLYPSACEMLKIRYNDAAKSIILSILWANYSDEDLSRMLP